MQKNFLRLETFQNYISQKKKILLTKAVQKAMHTSQPTQNGAVHLMLLLVFGLMLLLALKTSSTLTQTRTLLLFMASSYALEISLPTEETLLSSEYLLTKKLKIILSAQRVTTQDTLHNGKSGRNVNLMVQWKSLEMQNFLSKDHFQNSTNHTSSMRVETGNQTITMLKVRKHTKRQSLKRLLDMICLQTFLYQSLMRKLQVYLAFLRMTILMYQRCLSTLHLFLLMHLLKGRLQNY